MAVRVSIRFTLILLCCRSMFSFFFFNDTPTTEIYTLSLHDALPISCSINGTANSDCTVSIALIYRGSVFTSPTRTRSEEHTSELQSQSNLVCRLLLEKKKKNKNPRSQHNPKLTTTRQSHTHTLTTTN